MSSRTKFYLDKQNRKWLGVCSGIADYTGVDVTQGSLKIRDEDAAGTGQHDAAAPSFHDVDAEDRRRAGDLPTDGGLRDSQDVGGVGDVLGVRHRDQGRQKRQQLGGLAAHERSISLTYRSLRSHALDVYRERF